MTRLAILAALAVLSPIRRGLTYVEGRLAHAEYRMRHAGAWFVCVAVLAVGCGGVERHARTALDVSAHALVATDAIVAEVYEERASVALAASADLAEYRAAMERLDRTEAALRGARGALLAAEVALDAGDAEDVLGIVGCVADAMDRVLDALAAIDVDPPPKLRRAIDAIRVIAGDVCEGP